MLLNQARELEQQKVEMVEELDIDEYFAKKLGKKPFAKGLNELLARHKKQTKQIVKRAKSQLVAIEAQQKTYVKAFVEASYEMIARQKMFETMDLSNLL